MDGDGDIIVFGDPTRVVHVPSQAERIADLIAERDALAERVRLGDELKRALDSWLLTGDGWEDVGAARAAIAECGERA